MSGLLTLPAKTDPSMGRVKSTRPDKVGVPVDLDYYETAAEREAQKTAIAAVCEQVGLLDGTTPDSLAEMKSALEAGAYNSVLRRVGSAYGSQRIGGGLTAPTSGDDDEDGYAPGSWWVQAFGMDNPATLAFFVCIDASEGAAIWVRVDTGIRSVTVSGSLTALDSVILVDTSAGVVTLTLPAPRSGLLFVFKKTTLDTYEIVIDPPASESIEGGSAGSSFTLPSSDIALRGSWTLLCDGAGWWLV